MELKNKFDQIIKDSRNKSLREDNQMYTETFCYIGENFPVQNNDVEKANEYLAACFMKINKKWARNISISVRKSNDVLSELIKASNTILNNLNRINRELENYHAFDGNISVRCEEKHINFIYEFSIKTSNKSNQLMRGLSLCSNEFLNFKCQNFIRISSDKKRFIFSGELKMNTLTVNFNMKRHLNENTL